MFLKLVFGLVVVCAVLTVFSSSVVSVATFEEASEALTVKSVDSVDIVVASLV